MTKEVAHESTISKSVNRLFPKAFHQLPLFSCVILTVSSGNILEETMLASCVPHFLVLRNVYHFPLALCTYFWIPSCVCTSQQKSPDFSKVLAPYSSTLTQSISFLQPSRKQNCNFNSEYPTFLQPSLCWWITVIYL